MKKIISLFQRNYDGDRLVRDEVVPGAEWVLKGEGVPTRKYDGTCCLVENGQLFARYEVKKGKQPPPNFRAATDADPNTGKQQGWVPVDDSPQWKWHRQALENGVPKDGTYELCGPKIQSNPEGFDSHELIPHGQDVLEWAPHNFYELKGYLRAGLIEGIVWHHPDGRMVKIKARDFGFKRSKLDLD